MNQRASLAIKKPRSSAEEKTIKISYFVFVKVFLLRALIFIGLFILSELVLRIAGQKPGTLDNAIYPLDTLIGTPRFRGDENGITSFLKGAKNIPPGFILNKQGFRSPISFEIEVIDSLRQAKNQKVVFLVGDSYTEGCCAEPITNSFADKLYEDDEYILLNFGVGATDLLQYKLVIEKYAPILKPDLIVVDFYLGNDFAYYRRPVTPNVPVCFLLKDYAWLNSVGPRYLMENYPRDYFLNAKEAYHFYLNSYTLWGENATSFERMIRWSVYSKFYVQQREKARQRAWWRAGGAATDNDTLCTNGLLQEIDQIGEENHIPVLYVGIPSPQDVDEQLDLEEKYGKYFYNSRHVFPSTSLFSVDDYDGMETANHFNNDGHYKFYKFAREVIKNELNRPKGSHFRQLDHVSEINHGL